MKNKNLLVGIGIGVVVYYLYTRNKKKVQQPAVENPKSVETNPPASTSNNNKPNSSLGELVAKAPTTLPNNIFSPRKIRQTQEEKECLFQYISMPKPKAVMSAEYWKSHQENFIKDCIERKNKVR
jgi:hypothetical protein